MRTILHLISDMFIFFAMITIAISIICAVIGIFATVNWDRLGLFFSIGAILLAIGHTIYYFLDKD
mgnify:FL=1